MAMKTTADKTAKLANKESVVKKTQKEDGPANCHELSFVPDKGWALKRKGSEKVIKYYKTKLEGIEAIIKVSGNQGTHVVIRLKNGKFQKFDNAVRALNYAKEKGENDESEVK